MSIHSDIAYASGKAAGLIDSAAELERQLRAGRSDTDLRYILDSLASAWRMRAMRLQGGQEPV